MLPGSQQEKYDRLIKNQYQNEDLTPKKVV